MNLPDGWGFYFLMKYFCQHQILEKTSFSPHKIPKTKGVVERLILLGQSRLGRQVRISGTEVYLDIGVFYGKVQ